MKYVHFYISARIIQKNSGNKKRGKKGCKNQETTATALQLQYYSKFFRKKGRKKNALTTK